MPCTFLWSARRSASLRLVVLVSGALAAAACAPAAQAGAHASTMEPLPEPPAESPLPGDIPRDIPRDIAAMSSIEFGALRERGLMVPVAGVSPTQLTDSYGDPRDGGRRHEAVDILAPRGTPVLAADDGVVVRVGVNALGGNVVWQTDATRTFAFYYAHLDRYARGVREGLEVRRGDLLGYVGTTGNAPPNTPHLHFQVMRIQGVRRFSDGPPFNPLSYFTLAGATR